MTKCGNVVLIGDPNVGKSSIVNAIVGEHVSVVSDVPGTTRTQIRGIKTTGEYQIVFLDTPGINKARTVLDKQMGKAISNSLKEADVIVFVVDQQVDIEKLRNYSQIDKPIILAVNKTDKTNFDKLYPKLDLLNSLNFVKEIIPISAKTGYNVPVLEANIVKFLPIREHVFEQDDYTDQPTRKIAEEIIRGELIKVLKRELPHGIAVKIVKWIEGKKEIDIHAEIYCAKPSHKPIVIGKKGQVLKQIGTISRIQVQELVGKHVRLYTHVLVRSSWQDNPTFLREVVT